MELAQLADLGEFIGGVAVLATLLYLAAQVRQGNRLSRTRMHQEAARASTELSYFVGGRDEFLGLLARAADGLDSLHEDDRRRFYLVSRAALNYFETLFYARSRGEVEDEIWDSRILRMRQFNSRGLEETWIDHRPFYGASFVAFFESQVLGVDYTPNRVWDDAAS